MQFVGITRFNLVTTKTLRHFNSTANLSLEQAKDLVFSPDRLAAKLSTLESFCLPTYLALAEAEPRSHALILISHDLPKPYRSRLEELCARVPRVRIVTFGDHDSVDAVVDPILAEIANGDRVFNYRYDDDDVLAADFLSTVEENCKDAPDGTAVSLNRGLLMARLGDDHFGAYEQDDPLNAYGLGVIQNGLQPRNVFALGSHDRISAPVVHEVETISWVAFRHGLNDSQVNTTELNRLKRLAENSHTGAEAIQLLQTRFPHVTLNALEGLSELSIHQNLDTIARKAIRHSRKVRSALDSERKNAAKLWTELEATQAELNKMRAALDKTRAALTRTRKELRDVKTSRAYRVVRALADTRNVDAVKSLPKRLQSAARALPHRTT